jgi:hypothetical protein
MKSWKARIGFLSKIELLEKKSSILQRKRNESLYLLGPNVLKDLLTLTLPLPLLKVTQITQECPREEFRPDTQVLFQGFFN